MSRALYQSKTCFTQRKELKTSVFKFLKTLAVHHLLALLKISNTAYAAIFYCYKLMLIGKKSNLRVTLLYIMLLVPLEVMQLGLYGIWHELSAVLSEEGLLDLPQTLLGHLLLISAPCPISQLFQDQKVRVLLHEWGLELSILGPVYKEVGLPTGDKYRSCFQVE